MTEAIQRQSPSLSADIDDKFGQGAILVSLAWTVSQRGRTDESLDSTRRLTNC